MNQDGPSKHLAWSELECHDLTRTPYPQTWLDRATALAAEFESLRDACAKFLGIEEAPIDVISAYRTAAQNAKVGGAGASQHLAGRALDLAPPHGMTTEQFGAICMEQAQRRGIIRGVGVYSNDNHVHVDIRPEADLAFWRG